MLYGNGVKGLLVLRLGHAVSKRHATVQCIWELDWVPRSGARSVCAEAAKGDAGW